MSRALSCTCGAMEWTIADTAPGTHIACYCADCQAYAKHLGASGILDAQGGTEIFQTVPHHVAVTRGKDKLAALRLTPKGLLRWYAGCCGTPVANTLNGPGLPFVGMVLPVGHGDFGPVRARVNTKAAPSPVKEFGFAAVGIAILRRAAIARLGGHKTGAPFFVDGQPVLTPTVVSENGQGR